MSLAENDIDHISDVYARYVADYMRRWQTMLQGWQQPAAPRMVWMMYACNYLLVTEGIRWAVDPLRPNHLLKKLPHEVAVEPLQSLSLVLLTHGHSDHYDVPLLRLLAGGKVRFVVPEHLKNGFLRQVNPRPEQIITAQAGHVLSMDGLRIEPFDGWHRACQPDGRRTGVDATGYRVSMGKRRWLFPGDVRSYHPAALNPYAPVDRLFAHLWLGRGCAGREQPPFLDAFCDFMQGARPRAVTLTHLYEFSRNANDLWHQRHVEMVRRRWSRRGSSVPLDAPFIGEASVL